MHDQPAPRPSVFAVWHWPRWVIVVLVAILVLTFPALLLIALVARYASLG